MDLSNVCFWAKTTHDGQMGISVRDHCLNVGCVAEALFELLPPQLRTLLPRGIITLAALHDIGKISPGFQAKCPAWRAKYRIEPHEVAGRETDHAKISQYTVAQMLGDSRLENWAKIVAAHHGTLPGRWAPEIWEEERRRLAQELIAEFGPLPDQPAEDAILWFTAGLITVADWIGSDEQRFPDKLWCIAQRRQKAREALAHIGWKQITPKQSLSFSQLFPRLREENSLQKAAMEIITRPGIYVIEGPMGFGKTEAALAAAYKLIEAGCANGLYFALPTRVTSDRIHERVQPFVNQICAEAEQVRLVHSASWLLETAPPLQLRPAVQTDRDDENDKADEHARAGRLWFGSPKRALLAPFGVGTIDQALLGVVAANHFFVRQFGLAGKVVVLDEVHTYDLYTSTLINKLVQRLRELQSTVIILSATLTEARRRQLLQLSDTQPLSTAYPLVSGVAHTLVEHACAPLPPKTVVIRFMPSEVLVDAALKRAQQGACVLWIRNTVDDAQETYRNVRSANRDGGPPVALLHSRFPFFRREELENEWMDRLGKDSQNRPQGCVLVSTQVCEQSVDIDADLLITDLAPTDMLLQRLGRLWRHERATRPCEHPEVWIQLPPLTEAQLRGASAEELRQGLGKSARVYAPYVLLRSLQQWRARTSITIPTEIRAILEATYAEPAETEPPAWCEFRQHLEDQKSEMEKLALSATKVWSMPALKDEEGVQTRYNPYEMAQLLLVHQIGERADHTFLVKLLNGVEVAVTDRDWDFNAAKAIYLNITPVPFWTVSRLVAGQPAWLTNYAQMRTAVAQVLPDGRIRSVDGRADLCLSYHPDEGVKIHYDRIQQRPRKDDEYFD